jgi:hypothetical protein
MPRVVVAATIALASTTAATAQLAERFIRVAQYVAARLGVPVP